MWSRTGWKFGTQFRATFKMNTSANSAPADTLPARPFKGERWQWQDSRTGATRCGRVMGISLYGHATGASLGASMRIRGEPRRRMVWLADLCRTGRRIAERSAALS